MMLQSLKDHFSRVWQRRFVYGVTFSTGGFAINRYANGAFIFSLQGPTVFSAGTGHWPWTLIEAVAMTGPKASFHVGLLGLTFGLMHTHTVDNETGEIVGPDRRKFYFFFKGINHQGKQIEEIV